MVNVFYMFSLFLELDCQARIQVLEKELMEELKTLRHKQVIHPSLQEGKQAVYILLHLVVYYT